MSNEIEMLDISKCILSKLWYTTLIIYQENYKYECFSFHYNNDSVGFIEPETLITNLIHLQNENEHEWIVHVLLQKLINNTSLDTEWIEKRQSCIELTHALCLCKNVTIYLQQALLMLFKSNSGQKSFEISEKMYDEYFIFFKQNICNNPTVTCWILNKLFVAYSNISVSTINPLQDIYFSLLKELLDFKLSKQQSINDSSIGCALCIISKMNTIEFDSDVLFKQIFPMFLKTCNIQDVESALYSRSDRKFFNKWCVFLNEIYSESIGVNNFKNALKIQEVLFQNTFSSTPFINKNKLIERVINMKLHWVIDILDNCYTLIINGKYDTVSSVLSCNLLKTFWPVLLVKVLNEYSQKEIPFNEDKENNDFKFNLINFLISKCDFGVFHDSTLKEWNITLRKDLKILKYILSRMKENIDMKDYNQIQDLTKLHDFHQKGSFKQLFNFLHCLSTLSVLKMTTDIHQQEYNEIENLLEDLCESKSIFYAYCSISSALKAILLCDAYSTKKSVIANYFSDMKYYIQMLYPLSLRIQVIENIFCLLFLQHEDFDHIQRNYDKDNSNSFPEQSEFESTCIRQLSSGFICNKYAVKDILFYLEDIIRDVESEYTTIKGNNECKDEIDLLQKHIFFINAAITDAKWRLELYTNPEFTENMNVKDADKSLLTKTKTKVLLDRKVVSNRSKENVLFYQETSILDDTKVKYNSSSESEPIHSNTKSRKRHKNASMTTDATTIRDITHKPLFVNLLLATKESLIIRCLWKNDYAKAQDIIETSEMTNSQLNGEVQFSKALYIFKKNLYKQDTILKNKNQPTDNLKSSTLENIRLVTEEGIQSFRQTSQLETFLASQEINLHMLTMEVLNSNEMLTICALDVALTVSQICPISYSLCEVAMKYLKLCKTFDNTEYAHFFLKFHHLLYEKKDELSIENILCDAKTSLSLKGCREKDDFWKKIMLKHKEFKESQENKNTINKILKDSNYLPGWKILGNVTAIACGTKKYIQSICSYLQLLHSIIPAEHSIFTVSDLLKIPLHYYFGYQIFELKIEPHKLKMIAYNLQVNLAHSILINACPKFFYEKNLSCTNTSKENGPIILNKTLCKSELGYRIAGPNQCVAEILTELIHILHNLNLNHPYFNYDICRTISKHPNIQDVLKKTSRLVNLDLSELSVGNDTLTFLLNTWNLMYLHATLTIWAEHPPINSLQHTISLMSVGYLIGDLGLVTLAVLRSKLLGNMMLNDKFFIQVEELNEPAWQDLDITQNPKVVFMMANEYYGTPSIRVCNTESLNNDLINAYHEYLDYYSLKSEKSMQNTEIQTIISLPEIVECYRNSVCEHQKNDLHDDSNNSDLISVHEYFGSSDKNIIVQYTPLFYSYGILLKYSGCPIVHHQKQINQYKTVWKTYTIRSSLLKYLENQCWVISYLLQRIQNENPTILENNCDHLKRFACLENLLNSSWIKEMKSLFENNQTLTAIFETMSVTKLWSHFEFILNENQWNTCLKLINALPSHLAMSTELQYFKDKVLTYIISKKNGLLDTETLQYLYQIKNVHILSQTILYNINKWHINVCEEALLHAVYHIDSFKVPVHCKMQLNEILHRVLVCHKMLPYCEIKSTNIWYDIVYCTEKIDPLQIVKSLINADRFELCLEWMECQAFSLEIHPSIIQEFLIGLLKSESPKFKKTLKFLQTLPLDQSIKSCEIILKKLESIDSLQFICNYLLQYCKATETIKYQRTLLGIDILNVLELQERPLYVHLIKEPLLMLEQLLMNCKFETIQKILNKIQDKIEQVNISRNNFDEIIRFYAKKSLDCRVSLQCDTAESKSKNIQYSALESENAEFVMPLLVPTKEEWVPNDKARKCSCCKNVIFSMFNRRHHCRRCGRVICATCSQHRIQVSGYPLSVLVRVCDDCKRQTILQTHILQGTPSTSSSEVFDHWRLTRDQKHNETIREEFSFEYAPNISLCLAILNLHSDHKTYTSFLLDCCDEMKRFLQPVSGGKVNPEVDHTVIIKMIRSLLVAAKVKCAKLGLNTGLTHCDRFLSQVDLIASLVQSDCLHLIPSDNLDEHTLRKLRDLLIEKEQWTLALDVSTKAGLDRQGVWATWGKSCLKMGYFDQARDKFCHCLDKIQYESLDDWVILSYPKEAETLKKEAQKSVTNINKSDKTEGTKLDELSFKKIDFSKNRPLKDPPLLIEILQIIDNFKVHKQYMQYSHQYKSSAAQEILSNFGSFTMTNQQQPHSRNMTTIIQNVYYHESLYYLLTYGSYISILEFFLKHEEFDKCLTFTIQNDLEPDLFFSAVYLYCLKNGSVEQLQESMINKDSSLLMWKKYLIYVCHSLEKKQYLNILYQLQLFMKDSIRAAMTCIRFYLNEVSNYTDLCVRVNFLLDAQRHLEFELQPETLNRRRRKSTSSIHSNEGILTMEMDASEIDKHINTICRQMEVTKFLGNCEKQGRTPLQFLNLFPGKDSNNSSILELPTLFGNQQQKIDLAVLTILCGHNIEEGFGIAFRIMQDYNLPQQKVYSLAGHILTVKNNISGIEQLIKCCYTSGIPNSHIISDYVVTHCVKLLLNNLHNEPESVTKNNIHNLIRLITDVELKINAYIECKQLKAAYLLAVKQSRAQDVRKILKESDRLGQTAIKTICVKWLQQESKL